MPLQTTRDDKEVLDLILETARADSRIRAVLLNGSRVNPNVVPDAFQDFDVVYVVRDVNEIADDEHWIERFGTLMILQTPDRMGDPAQHPDTWQRFGFLAQFQDGTRIDLSLVHVDSVDMLREDSLTELLLDKDGLFDPFPAATDKGYFIKRPEERQFCDCCNEFFWVAPYAAKGLWRRQPVYARHAIEDLMRPQLMTMLTWYVGMQQSYGITAGAYNKYLHSRLDPAMWRLLQRTWKDADADHMWYAIFTMIRLFRRAATEVAKAEGLDYPVDEDRNVTAFLQHIRKMPEDAAQICP